jgi:hypothetical protein
MLLSLPLPLIVYDFEEDPLMLPLPLIVYDFEEDPLMLFNQRLDRLAEDRIACGSVDE